MVGRDKEQWQGQCLELIRGQVIFRACFLFETVRKAPQYFRGKAPAQQFAR